MYLIVIEPEYKNRPQDRLTNFHKIYIVQAIISNYRAGGDEIDHSNIATLDPFPPDKTMSYAGFWVRSGALLVDSLIFLPPMILYDHLFRLSWITAVIIQIPFLFLWSAYNIYFLGHWGQTIGKMATNVKVTRRDGSPIGYKQAFLRHIIDLALETIHKISVLIALFSVSRITFEISGWEARNALLRDVWPYWGFWVVNAVAIWTLSELIVLLLNKKKRALHDFIAGTVVIRTTNLKQLTPIEQGLKEHLEVLRLEFNALAETFYSAKSKEEKARIDAERNRIEKEMDRLRSQLNEW